MHFNIKRDVEGVTLTYGPHIIPCTSIQLSPIKNGQDIVAAAVVDIGDIDLDVLPAEMVFSVFMDKAQTDELITAIEELERVAEAGIPEHIMANLRRVKQIWDRTEKG